MTRPFKEGVAYIPLDVDMDEDDKIQLIESVHGVKGFGILIKLMMKIYRNGYYYKWEEKEELLFSRKVGEDVAVVQAVVADCIKWEIFNRDVFEKHKVLTSKGIQKRFFEIAKRRVKIEVDKNLLLLNNGMLEVYENIVYVNNNPENVNNNTHKEVKEVKEGEEVSKEEGDNEKKQSVPYQEIKDLFHKTCPSFSTLRDMSAARKRVLKPLWDKNPSLDFFKELFEKAEDSDFLTGRVKSKNPKHEKWKADFDWIINHNNATKILEGKYKNKSSQNGGYVLPEAQAMAEENL